MVALRVQCELTHVTGLLMTLSLSLSLNEQVRYVHHKDEIKEKLAAIIPEKQKEVKEFRAQHGNTVVGEVSVDMVSVGTI